MEKTLTKNLIMKIFDINISLKSLAILAALITIVAACGSAPDEVRQAEPYCLSESIKAGTAFYTAALKPVNQSLTLTGKVQHNPDKMVNFVSLVGGMVISTHFSLGDQVQKGQLLAEIRSAELSNMQAERNALRAQLQVAARRVEAVQAMFDDGIASKKELMEVTSERDILQYELDRVKAQMAMFSTSDERGVFQIKAPVSGIVVLKNIAPGMQIPAEGEPLFTISDLSEVWVALNVYARDIALVREGMPVGITTLSYGREVFEGKISAIARVFDTDERVLKARVIMPNPELKLMPGMLVDAEVDVDLDSRAVAVPSGALIFDNDRYHLIIYRGDCDLSIRKVELLGRSNNKAFLQSDIAADEVVVTQNHLLIYEQLKSNQTK